MHTLMSKRRALLAGVALLVLGGLSTACNANEQALFMQIVHQRESVKNNSFLVCVRAHESDTAGSYWARNPSSGASGAYQFLDSTWRVVAARAGHGAYAGAPARNAPDWVQDAVAYDTAITRGERRHWHGTGCPGS
ncbi:MAG: transglycosylase family protein [Candidatus Saccharibacteria bacterium]